MLSKKERLSREMFNRFFVSGKRFSTDSLNLVYTPRPTLHAAIVISKKVAKKAVARNKLRRQLYALVREVMAHGVWIIVVRKTAKIPSRATLKGELLQIYTKLTQH